MFRKVFQKYNIPTDSATQATLHVANKMAAVPYTELSDIIFELSGERVHYEYHRMYLYHLGYLCGEILKGTTPDMWHEVTVGRIKKLAGDSSYIWKHEEKIVRHVAESDEPVEVVQVEINKMETSEQSTVRKRKGVTKRAQLLEYVTANKVTRAQALHHCMTKLDMTKTGATTYVNYPEIKQKFVVDAANGSAPKRGEVFRLCLELMQANPTFDRASFIDAAVKANITTAAGASTAFYSAYEAVHGTKPPKQPKGRAAAKLKQAQTDSE